MNSIFSLFISFHMDNFSISYIAFLDLVLFFVLFFVFCFFFLTQDPC